MNEALTKTDLTSAINRHELDAAKRQANLKESIIEKIEADRHECKNRFQKHEYHISDNKEALSLFQQSHNYMEKKIDSIETNLKEGISDLKTIIEKQGDAFATKEEVKRLEIANSRIIKIMWTIGIAVILGGGAFIWSKITSII